MSIMNKTYVFDFDGVILKNENISNHIHRLSIEFFSKSFKVNHQKAIQIQTKYLANFGHTSKLCHFFDKSHSEFDWMRYYNSYVFSIDNLNLLNSYLTDDDVLHINTLCDIKYDNIHKYILFSNASFLWINNILSISDVDIDSMFDDVFCSDNNYLKPHDSAYIGVESVCPQTKLFIDDNITNLKVRDGWECYHHCMSDSDQTLYDLLI